MVVKVKVIPRAKKFRIEPFVQGLKVYLTKSPVKGQANKQLIEVIAQHYGVKKNKISIVKGQRQRDKILEIID